MLIQKINGQAYKMKFNIVIYVQFQYMSTK